MATYEDYISERFDPSRTIDDVKNELIALVHAADPALDLSEGQPLLNIVSIFATAIESIREFSLSMYYDLSPFTASLGALINVHGALWNVEYRKGEKTLYKIQMEITEPCTIYHDTNEYHTAFKIMANNTGNIYIPSETRTFESAGIYEVDFESENTGSYVDEPLSITTILTTTLGVKSVNNLSSYYSLGSETEAVEKYRQRILEASRLLFISGTLEQLKQGLLNIGCNDVLVYKNLSTETTDEVPAGRVAIVIKGGDKEAIAKKIADLLYGVSLHGFGIVPDIHMTENYCFTISLLSTLANFYSVSNGTLSFKINDETITSNDLDFTSCSSLADIVAVINSDSVLSARLTATIDSSNMSVIFTGLDNEPIEMVETTTAPVDLYTAIYFVGVLQSIVRAGQKNISNFVLVNGDRQTTSIVYNDTIVVEVSLLIQTNLSVNNVDEARNYILSELQSRNLLKINKALTQIEIADIVNDFFTKNGMEDYAVVSASLKREDEVDYSGYCATKHIYEIFNIQKNNITFS